MLYLAIALIVSAMVISAPAAPGERADELTAAVLGAPSTPADIVEQIAPSLVQVIPQTNGNSESSIATGSGVAVPGGIVTSDHVVADADQATVVASDGRRGDASVIRRSPIRDLVLLRTDLALPPVQVGIGNGQRAGDTLLAIGYPRPDGLGATTVTVTRGLISALRRDQEGITYVQTDAPMDPGLAGGALVNMQGLLIGVPSFSSDQTPGANFGVGAEEVQALIEQEPAQPSSELAYSGDPNDLLPTQDNMGPGWQAVPQPFGGSLATQSEAGPSGATSRLVKGDPTAPAGSFGELRTAALVVPDPQHAEWAWERALEHPPTGFNRLPDPAVSSTCHLYQRAGHDITDVQVLCRESNVVFAVMLSGTSDLATLEGALGAAGAIIERVRNGGRQAH